MSINPIPSSRPPAGMLRALLIATVAALAGTAQDARAQAATSPTPGLWHLWRTDSPRAPTTPPALTLCVNAAGARDLALLMGEAPGDGSCRVRETRRTDPLGVEVTLNCPGGRLVKASVRFSSGEAFLTRLDAAKAGDPGFPTQFVHGRRDGECTR